MNSLLFFSYAILTVKSTEDAERLDILNGVEMTATEGKWRTYNLAIYPIKKESEGMGCVYVT